ncbi:MAG: PD-(D/E)XK nuclease-like domain-containing protein [Pseudobdellovibrionaceae bacterium]|nr:PD-(D/E)XK nuclease-like domain-containing protein [Pseudobdellovibrionaceae bacterium]
MQPGIYPDLDIKKYHSSPGDSKTSLCKLDRAPKVFRDFRDSVQRPKATRSLQTGSIFHIVMEGEFERQCRVGPEVNDKRAKEWKQFVKENPGRICVTPDEARQVLGMRAAMYEYGPARKLLSKPGRFEVSYYWIDPGTGLLCKCRPDWISADQKLIVDFKTAADVTEQKFVRSAGTLHYHVSAAMTAEGVYRTTGILPESYTYLAIEATPPYLTAAYEATANDFRLGRRFVRRNLALLKRCQDNGAWPGLPEEVRALDVERFMYRGGHEENDEAETLADGEPVSENWWE